MAITSALIRSSKTKILSLAAAASLASAAFAHGAMPLNQVSGGFDSPPQQQLATSSARLGSSIRTLGGMFPAVGLAVALWATQHVRRRNARQMAAVK
ncbi:MAG: hypothetical protein ACR2FX_09245 [Chthoniobacterales bacterium]